jgi:predicted Zn-dependent peptidase
VYRKTQLANGIRIVTEEVSSFHSVSLGINVAVGSRFEEASEGGYSHFLEHMLFKGTPGRTAPQIAREIESVGGILNAFTAREYTSYYCKVLYENTGQAVDLLSDIFLNSTFDPDELEREREVIKEEVRMVDDIPEDLVVDLHYGNLFPGHALGKPIMGTFASLDGLTRDSLIAYRDRLYKPDQIIVAAAGRVEHDAVVALVAKAFDGFAGKSDRKLDCPKPMVRSASFHHKPSEQVHICMGTAAYSFADPRRMALLVLNTELGGGMGSRLFQEIREKRGLAYSVGSHSTAFLDTGVLEVFLGTAQKNVKAAVDVCLEIFEELRRNPLTAQMVQEAKNQLKGGLLMSLESSDSRMGRMARNEIYLGEYVSAMDLIERIDAVTIDDVAAVGAEVLRPDAMVLTLLGDQDRVELPAGFQVQ